MCGRYTYAMTKWPKVWADLLGDVAGLPLERSWNLAPTRKVPVVVAEPGTKRPLLKEMVWGLVPSWAKDMTIGSRLINARGETVAEKPAYRAAFRQRRCLMLTTGFYEWQHAGTKDARPWFIRHKDAEVFAFAAIWETWTNQAVPEIGTVETCAIVTIHANAAIAPVHHRMPVILDPDDYAKWLDPARRDPEDVKPLIRPCPPDWISLHPVSRK